MSAPCPPEGGIITSNSGAVVPVGTPPATRSTVPYVYPEPPLEIVILSTVESLLITIVAFAPDPSPLIGTSEYVTFGLPSATPRLLMRMVFNCPLVSAFSLIAAVSALVDQFLGTGIKFSESNFTISVGLIVEMD